MDFIIKIFMTIVISIVMTMVSCKQAITMKALVLTANLDVESVILALDSYGIPYDIIKVTSSNNNLENLNLYNDSNEPKYNLVIVNGSNLPIKENDMLVSALSDEQWTELNEYEVKHHIRRVIIADDASTNPLVKENYRSKSHSLKLEEPVHVANSDTAKEIFNDAGVKFTAPFDVSLVTSSEVEIISTNTTQPLLVYEGTNGVAATISKFENGREEMNFFFNFVSWSQTCIILNHVWLNWGTRSLYNGFRRVYFTPQVDDVFLSTSLVDLVKGNEVGGEELRVQLTDFQKTAQFQKDILSIMPEGSLYKIELAFNGNGILKEEAIDIDVNSHVDTEYIMEPGMGEKRWPMENYELSNSQIEKFEKDEVFNYFSHNQAAQKDFFWTSHTFSHLNLDNASKSDVDNEIRLNIEVAGLLGLIDKNYWSGNSIITPQNSGLHNKDALEVLKKYGINSAIGDLSRSSISNLEHPYQPFITTKESSNLEGFVVVPRSPTEIYRHCSTMIENTWMYNKLYNDFVDFNEFLETESARTLLLMTKLRHEAHLFHQENIRHYEKEGNNGESLLEVWTRSTVELYNRFVNWPLISLKLDDQAEAYVNRVKLDSCGHETKLIVENNKIVSIEVSASKGDCTVPITVPANVNESSLPANAYLEQVGRDPLTVWIPLKKGEKKSFQLQPAVEWGFGGFQASEAVLEEAIKNEVANNTTIVDSSMTIDDLETTVVSSSLAPTGTIETMVITPVITETIETTVIPSITTETIETTETTIVTPITSETIETVINASVTTESVETIVVTPETTESVETIIVTPETTEAIETIAVTPETTATIETIAVTPETTEAIETIAVTPETTATIETIAVTPETTATIETIETIDIPSITTESTETIVVTPVTNKDIETIVVPTTTETVETIVVTPETTEAIETIVVTPETTESVETIVVTPETTESVETIVVTPETTESVETIVVSPETTEAIETIVVTPETTEAIETIVVTPETTESVETIVVTPETTATIETIETIDIPSITTESTETIVVTPVTNKDIETIVVPITTETIETITAESTYIKTTKLPPTTTTTTTTTTTPTKQVPITTSTKVIPTNLTTQGISYDTTIITTTTTTTSASAKTKTSKLPPPNNTSTKVPAQKYMTTTTTTTTTTTIKTKTSKLPPPNNTSTKVPAQKYMTTTSTTTTTTTIKTKTSKLPPPNSTSTKVPVQKYMTTTTTTTTTTSTTTSSKINPEETTTTTKQISKETTSTKIPFTTTTATTTTTTRTTPSSKPTEVKKCENQAWSQCGGIGFSGETCCRKGYYCKEINEYYFQCVPNETTTTTSNRKTTTTRYTTTTTIKTTKKTTTKKNTTTTTTKNTTTNNSNNSSNTGSACTNGPWDTCGGIDYKGSTCCPKGYFCQEYSAYYSQCIPV